MTHPDLLSQLTGRFGADAVSALAFRGEQTISIAKSALVEVLRFCRDELGFDGLVDITTVDQLGKDPRFEIAYELFSYRTGLSLRIRSATSEDDAEFPTVTHLWPAADWHEREAYDMMGVRFAGHPNLKRILMWEGYPYFPLRKEFPLAGKPSEMPDVAFTNAAPLEGGPFVTGAGATDTIAREPRARGE